VFSNLTRDIHPDNRSGTRTTLELCNQAPMDRLIPQGSDGILQRESHQAQRFYTARVKSAGLSLRGDRITNAVLLRCMSQVAQPRPVAEIVGFGERHKPLYCSVNPLDARRLPTFN
jgi:hypothetical protein